MRRRAVSICVSSSWRRIRCWRSGFISKKWAHQDSNLERAGYEPAALTVELWARSSLSHRLGAAFQKRLQLARPGRVAELAQRFRLDLADALARDREVLADLLERVLAAVAHAEPHLDHLLLARRQRLEHGLRLFLEVQVN